MQIEKRAYLPVHPDSIRLNVTAPATTINLGFFKLDPVAQLIGRPIAEILEPLMVAPSYRRPSVSGPAVDVFPVALPEGEGLSVPVGVLGEVGFRNSDGLLVLTVPAPFAPLLRAKLGTAVIQGPTIVSSSNGEARVAELHLELSPGMRTAIPLGLLGELGVEAG